VDILSRARVACRRQRLVDYWNPAPFIRLAFIEYVVISQNSNNMYRKWHYPFAAERIQTKTFTDGCKDRPRFAHRGLIRPYHFRSMALRENSEKRPIGGDLSVLPFLGWLASGFQPGAADLGQLPAESIAVSESLESWNSRIVRG